MLCAPHALAEYISRAAECLPNIIHAIAGVLKVGHVIPNGKGRTNQVGVTGRDVRITHIVGAPVVVHPLVVLVHAVVIGKGHNVEVAVIGVDELVTGVHGLNRVLPVRAPEVHFYTLGFYLGLTGLVGKAAPNAGSITTALNKLEQAVRVLAVGLSITVELISAYVYHAALQHGTAQFLVLQQVFVKHLAHKLEGLRVVGVNVVRTATGVAHGTLVDKLRAYLGERKGVSGGIELRHDVDAALLGVVNQITELFLGEVYIICLQLLTVCTHHVALQTEGGVGFLQRVMTILYVFLQEDVVVIDNKVQVIHLVPSHGIDDVAHVLEGVGRASNVEQYTTHLIARYVISSTIGHAAFVLLEDLQHGARTPENAVLTAGGNADTALSGSEGVVLILLRGSVFLNREVDIRLVGAAQRSYGNHFLAKHGLEVCNNNVDSLLVNALKANNHLVTQLVFTFATLPLQNGGNHLRLGIAGGSLICHLHKNLVVLTEGLFAVLCYSEVNIDGGITDNSVDGAICLDDILIVCTEQLDCSALHGGNGQFTAAYQLCGHGQIISNLLSVLPGEGSGRHGGCQHHKC